MLRKISLYLVSLLLFTTQTFANGDTPFVEANLIGRLGNQMFQIATTCAHAWDHGAEPIFPKLDTPQKAINLPTNRAYIFWKIPRQMRPRHPKVAYRYFSTAYQKIPFEPDQILTGFFQSEKYFAHHKERILDLFEPHPTTKRAITRKYQHIINHPQSVSVHIRCYWPFQPKKNINGKNDGKGILPFLGFDFFKRAMKQFHPDSLFVIFSDNIRACKQHLGHAAKNILFITNEPHYHDLHLMSLCKHNIISNSTFSWWGAYLNRNPEKVVVAPKRWFEPSTGMESEDIIPDSWVRID